MTKAEIVSKVLTEMGPFTLEYEPPYSDEPDDEEVVIAELEGRLPNGVEINTLQ